MEKNYKDDELFCVGKVESDDTMRDWIQQLEFEIVLRQPLEFQLTIDRKNKYKLSDSRPVCFLHFSDLSQVIRIVELALRSAYYMVYGLDENANREKISEFIDRVLKRIKETSVEVLDLQKDALINKYKERLWKKTYGNNKSEEEIVFEFEE